MSKPDTPRNSTRREFKGTVVTARSSSLKPYRGSLLGNGPEEGVHTCTRSLPGTPPPDTLTQACILTFTHAHPFTHLYTQTHALRMHAHICLHPHIHSHPHTRAHTHTHSYSCTRTKPEGVPMGGSLTRARMSVLAPGVPDQNLMGAPCTPLSPTHTATRGHPSADLLHPL